MSEISQPRPPEAQAADSVSLRSSEPIAAPRFCYSCGAPLGNQAPGDGALQRPLLACPACHSLVYVEDLKKLAEEAGALEAKGDIASAAALWGKALALLPADSAEAASIRQHRAELGAQSRVFIAPPGTASAAVASPTSYANGGPNPGQSSNNSGTDWKKRLGPLGVVVAFLAKFKTAGLLLLTKGKFLLLGLTKLNTLLSMFASMGFYWALYGWKFAVGFVLGIYVHEMGHVWALKHFGLRASAPMFIPGFGAFVSLYDSPANVSQDARIGLAGPIWGTAAALFCRIMGILAGSGLWLAVAHVTAWINLLNLIPIWQLDGGRGFRALDRNQRLMSMALMGAMWYVTDAGMFLILALGAAFRVFWQKDHPPVGDRIALAQYAGLLITLGALLAKL